MARYTLIAPDVPAVKGASERLVTCDIHNAPHATRPAVASASSDFLVLVDGVAKHTTLLDAGPPWLLSIDGKPCEVVAEPSGEYRVLGSGATLRVATGRATRASAKTARNPYLLAPMPGRVVRVLCQPGDIVEPGAALVVLEAMKMENELVAPSRGRVEEVFVHEGSAVDARARLVALGEA